MSLSQVPSDQDNLTEEESSVQDTSETVECPNCGRVFTGTYCPDCGQEADPSASITGVVGGFFRELVDVEHGFWPTFVGLTVRPGKTLRAYLSGIRKGLTRPGRYLLAAVVVDFGAQQFLLWIGVESGPSSSDPEPPPPDASGVEKASHDMASLFDALGALINSSRATWSVLCCS